GSTCISGACTCNGGTCTGGCCNGSNCISPSNQSLSLCGPNGQACVACPSGRADNCTNGICRGGSSAACAVRQACPNGACAARCQGTAGVDPPTNAAYDANGWPGTVCPAGSDSRVSGQCRCGSGNPCDAGQACVNGACVCNAGSCPSGCCQNGVTCITN